MFCTSCGKSIAEGARFCQGCGAPAPAAPAGAPGQAAAPPQAARPVAATQVAATGAAPTFGEVLKNMAPLKLVAAGGLAVSFISLWFEWVSVSQGGQSVGSNSWDGDFQIADWIGLPDAWLVLLLSAAGLFVIFAPEFGKAVPGIAKLPPNIPVAALPAIAGGLIAVIGLLEFRYIGDFITSTPGVDAATAKQFGFSIDRGFGIYLLILSGVATAVATVLDWRGVKLGGK
jgi:hypothetical protein